ncbi:MAG: response regulator [Spirochaetota bacterium]
MKETFSNSAVPNILVVDDTPANLELLSGLLRAQGYAPRPVPSGKLALAAARAEAPDLVLLDIRMPEMDGFEVCERLKADETLRDVPVIFITAAQDREDKVRAFSLGAVDYVTKPFQVEELQARVRTHLHLRSLQRDLKEHQEAILETALDGFMVASREGRLLEVNATFCRMTGYSQKELLTLRIADL